MSKKVKKVEEVNAHMEWSIDNCKIGDKVYLTPDGEEQYEILDIGSPFSLILNLSTNFAYLYKSTKFYI